MLRKLVTKGKLPLALYTAEQVLLLDQAAIKDFKVNSLGLMERAGEVAFEQMKKIWPMAKTISIVCGPGNNGGDGFVVGKIALEAGMTVILILHGNIDRLRYDARTCADKFILSGGNIYGSSRLPNRVDLIIDALWGIGLDRPVIDADAKLIQALNRHPAPIFSIDIPSGLNADTGRVMGASIRAQATISYIGLKRGLFTGQGCEHVGKIFFHALDIPAKVYAREILSARRFDWKRCQDWLTPRSRYCHKGSWGHVLVVGGDEGYSGAVRLAAEAALKTGAGVVSVATHPNHAQMVNIRQPEIMCRGVLDASDLLPMIEKAQVIILGPGLGLSGWSQGLFQCCMYADKCLVVDADALNLLAKIPTRNERWVLTPHPKEAARLLGLSVDEVEGDRFSSIEQLQKKYNGTILLKGAGTLVYSSQNKPVAVCTEGNPGMASAGMGDLLSGIIGAWIAQGFDLEDATVMGACLHGAAADCAAISGERGLVASDLLPEIRSLINPE